MKATIRFYSTKTGELLRSQQVNMRVEVIDSMTSRTYFDPPITVRPDEEFKVEPVFDNPILR